MKCKKIKWTVITVLFVLFMYSQSMLPATVSSGESTYALGVVGNFFSSIGLKFIALTEHIIRKSAHFIEYTIFGVLLINTIRIHGFIGLTKWLLVMVLGIAVPFIDETIQLFVPGRSGQITDVWLDMSGVLAGICIVTVFLMIRRRFTGRTVREEM